MIVSTDFATAAELVKRFNQDHIACWHIQIEEQLIEQGLSNRWSFELDPLYIHKERLDKAYAAIEAYIKGGSK